MPQEPTDAYDFAAHDNHEFRMTFFWCFCVWLVLAGLVFRREVRAVLLEARLRLFGERVRVRSPRPLPYPPRATLAAPGRNTLPPPRFVPRAGP